MQILGITGFKQSGKDEACKAIQSYLTNVRTRRIGFADALKEEISESLGVSLDFIEMNKTIFRPMLQWHGTDFRRNLFGDDYWIRKVSLKLIEWSKDSKAPYLVIIPDVRFQNEADFIHNNHGKILRIIREDSNDAHTSESSVVKIHADETIVNRFMPLHQYHQEVVATYKKLFPITNSEATKKVLRQCSSQINLPT